MRRSWLTRALHALLALAVTHQLLVSLVMEEPEEGEAEGLLFELHETVGLVTLGILLAFWLWTLVRRDETPPGALFPWLSSARLRELAADTGRHLAALARLRLPEYRPAAPLAAAVHGLGLLAVTGSALSGFAWWLGEEGLLAHGLAEAAEEVHELFGSLVWAYLVGHAGMAVLHRLAGHDEIGAMFRLGPGGR